MSGNEGDVEGIGQVVVATGAEGYRNRKASGSEGATLADGKLHRVRVM